jgi:hypothetical protein
LAALAHAIRPFGDALESRIDLLDLALLLHPKLREYPRCTLFLRPFLEIGVTVLADKQQIRFGIGHFSSQYRPLAQ